MRTAPVFITRPFGPTLGFLCSAFGFICSPMLVLLCAGLPNRAGGALPSSDLPARGQDGEGEPRRDGNPRRHRRARLPVSGLCYCATPKAHCSRLILAAVYGQCEHHFKHRAFTGRFHPNLLSIAASLSASDFPPPTLAPAPPPALAAARDANASAYGFFRSPAAA